MKTNLLHLFAAAIFILLSANPAPADTNPPPRLTIDLRDGSRVVGTSVEKNLKFRSVLFGDFNLAVQDLRSLDCVASNSVKLKAANGDTLAVQFADSSYTLKTSEKSSWRRIPSAESRWLRQE